MNFFIFKCFTLLFGLLSFGIYAQNDVRDASTGETFPSEVSFEYEEKNFHLQATGVATRKKFFVKVYSIAHYLQTSGAVPPNADKFQVIMNDDNAKQFTIKWLRSVNAEKVREGFMESFSKSLSPSDFSSQQADINKFVHLFNRNVQKGDEDVIRWLPGGYVEVVLNGSKAGSIKNVDFAKALWNIWFGSNSVVDRNNLVSLMK